MPMAAFAAGAALALLALRVMLAVINHFAAKRRRHVNTMIVLGSGGHTAEMMALLRGLDLDVYRPRCYVVAATDGMSGQKAAAFEEAAASAAAAALPDEETPLSASKSRTPGRPAAGGTPHRGPSAPTTTTATPTALRRSQRVAAAAAAPRHHKSGSAAHRALPGLRSPDSPAKRRTAAVAAPRSLQQRYSERYSQQHGQQYTVVHIPRSREVGQSFLSSIPTTLGALWAAVTVVFDHQPDLVLVNGPGTCIPIAAAACLLRCLGICGAKVVYVESIARVYRLSLSGKILYHSRLAHTFFVQWEDLQQRYPRAVYAGRLM